MRERQLGTCLVGLVFLCAAAISLWYATGHAIAHTAVRFVLPVLLIALGLLGVRLGRRGQP